MQPAISTVLLSLAAVAMASPLPRADHVLYLTTPYESNGQPTYVSANLVQNGTSKEYLVLGERLSVYPGTPYSRNGGAGKENLFFDIGTSGKRSGLFGPYAGLNSGATTNVFALDGQVGDGLWSVDEKTKAVTHKSGPQADLFLLCTDTVNGKQEGVLKIGNRQADGTLPAGCQKTELLEVDI